MIKAFQYRIIFAIAISLAISLTGVVIYIETERQNDILTCQRASTSDTNRRVTIEDVSQEFEDYNLFPNSIQALHNPDFIPISELSGIIETTPGIGIEREGEARFYPFNVAIWHVVINDCINGIPIMVSYCPICQTGVVYNRTVDGQVLDFEVEGTVWLDNILVQDTESNSLWSTILGESVQGEFHGVLLEQIVSNITTIEQWKRTYPDSLILSVDTGFDFPYDTLIDYSPEISNEAPANYLEQFVLINQFDQSTMYLLQPPGTILMDNNVEIVFFDDNVSVKVDGEEYDDYIITPRYVWEDVVPQAQLVSE